MDLVGYEHQAGGLDLVATVLSELAEKVDPHKLAAAADRVAPLKEYVRARAPRLERNRDWKLSINTAVETDL